MAAVLLRCFIMYCTVILAVRLMGKRQIGELQPAELVITILISELASMPMQDLHLPILTAIMPILALVLLEVAVSLLALKSVRARGILFGHPLILIYRGEFRQNAMTSARVTVDDIMEIMRNNGIVDVSEVDYAVLETNGQLSVIAKQPNSAGIPRLLIMDGKVMGSNLREIGRTRGWLQKQLAKHRISSVKSVFLMTVDDSGKIEVVKKQ